MKKLLSLFLLSGIITSSFGTISCSSNSNTKTDSYLYQDIVSKFNNSDYIKIIGNKLNYSLETSITINAIENYLNLSSNEKVLIKSITSKNNQLEENKPVEVSFMIYDNNILKKITKPVVIITKDDTALSSYKIYQLKKFSYNNKNYYLENTSNGLYVSYDLNSYQKINIPFKSEDTLTINYINYIFGNLYIGTNKGTYFTANNDFNDFSKLITTNLDLNNTNINGIYSFGNTIYFATDIGLYSINNDDVLKTASMLLDNQVFKLILFNNFFAITNDGLYISYDKTDFYSVGQSSFINKTINNGNVFVYDIYKTKILNNDFLFLSTNNGLYFANLQYGNWTKYYKILNSTIPEEVYVTKKVNNIIYIGTNNGLYYSYDYLNFISDNSLNNTAITSINTFDDISNTTLFLTTNSKWITLTTEKVGLYYYYYY